MIRFLEKSRAATLGLVTEFLASVCRDFPGGIGGRQRGKRQLWFVKTKVSGQTGLMRGLVWKREKKL